MLQIVSIKKTAKATNCSSLTVFLPFYCQRRDYTILVGYRNDYFATFIYQFAISENSIN